MVGDDGLKSVYISKIYDKKPHKCPIKYLTNVKYKLIYGLNLVSVQLFVWGP